MRVKGSVTEGNARLEIIMVHGEKALGTVWYRLDISAFVGQVLIRDGLDLEGGIFSY